MLRIYYFTQLGTERLCRAIRLHTLSLDTASRVGAVSVPSSPSELLNAAALDAARKSTYATAIVNCEAVASTVLFSATCPVAPLPPPGP